MTQLSVNKGKEEIDREIRKWLDKWDFSYETYLKLPPHLRDRLCYWVCAPSGSGSDRQRRDLYYRMFSIEGTLGGRKSPNPVDRITDEELRSVFSPLPPSERLDYFDKF